MSSGGRGIREEERFEYGFSAEDRDVIWFKPCCEHFQGISLNTGAYIGEDKELMVRPNHRFSHIPLRFCPSCGAIGRFVEGKE